MTLLSTFGNQTPNELTASQTPPDQACCLRLVFMPPRRELQMSETRIERDSMGELAVPADALYGAQTQRAVNNFAISGRGMPPRFIHAVLLIKKVAAEVNADLGLLPTDIASAIGASADDLFSDPNCAAHFPVDIFQTGSGTSTNMNANEVLATLAGRRLGSEISPNDHVNCSQSSNDVIPTAIHVSAAIALKEQLQPALSHLTATIRAKQTRPIVSSRTGAPT